MSQCFSLPAHKALTVRLTKHSTLDITVQTDIWDTFHLITESFISWKAPYQCLWGLNWSQKEQLPSLERARHPLII